LSFIRKRRFARIGFLIPFFLAFAGLIAIPAMAAPASFSVQSQETSLPTASMTDAAYGNGVYVAVGYYGAIIRSTNGNDWTTVKDIDDSSGYTGVGDPSTFGFRSVTFGNGLFVAVGDSGVILTSPDGTTWTQRTSGVTSHLNQAEYLTLNGTSAFYVTSEGKYVTSTNGTSWSSVTPTGLGSTTYLGDVTVGNANGRLVIGGSDGYLYSTTNGSTWTRTRPTQPGGGTVTGINMVKWMNDRYYISDPSAYLWTSTDLSTFTLMGAPFKQDSNSTGNQMFDGFYDGTTYYLFGYQAPYGYGAVYTSTNGTTWTMQTFQNEFVVQNAVYANGKYFRLGNEGMLVSHDGENWEYKWGGTFYEVFYDGSKYVAVGSQGSDGRIWTSSDLTTWSLGSLSARTKTYWAGAYGGGTYVAIGDLMGTTTGLATSANGTSWTVRTTINDSSTLYDIAYGNGAFVAVGGKSGAPVVKRSTDGVTWTSPALPTHNIDYLSTIAYVNNQFVAIGMNYDNSGNTVDVGVWTSPDGQTWTDRAYPESTDTITGVLYDGSKYIWTGYDAFWQAFSRTSNDMVTWSDATVLENATYYSMGSSHVGHTGGQLYAFLYDWNYIPKLYYSENQGTTWQDTGVDLSATTPYTLATVNGRVVISGASKLIMATAGTVSNASISPETATFDKNTADTSAGHYRDVAATLTPNGNTLSDITRAGSSVGGSNYSVSGNNVTLKKEYLATLGTGEHVFTFDMSAGTDPTLTVTISDTTPQNLNSPVITSDGGGAAAAVGVNEGATAVTTVTATDADAGATLSYSIAGGADAGAFSINASTGALTFQSAPNYEAPGDSDGNNAYVVTVQASDGTNTDTQTITVTVSDVNEFAPAITSDGGASTASVDANENVTSVTTVAATDGDGTATISYSIAGGADAGAFSINASTGALTFQSAPNYELPGDSDGDNAYVVTVQASDGTNTDTQTITVYVDDINDASPVITSDGGDATASVGASEGATAVTAVTATDADAGATLSYSIVGGADAGAFSINASTGALTFQSAPNYELPGDSDGDNAYVVTVQASDGTNADTQTITVTVSDANEFAPSITYDGGGETADAAVDEGGTAVATIAATDGDDTATLGYSIVGGADAGAFSINASTGALTFQSAPNYEAPGDSDGNNAYVVTVQVSDGTNTDTQTITVTVNDANEFAPAITSDGGGATAGVNVDENTTSVTTVTATDADGTATISYSIAGGADAGAFSINASTGALTFQSAPDREQQATYTVQVQANDGTNADTQTITVTVDDANDTAPEIVSDGGGATADVDANENATSVTTVAATDADTTGTLTYSIAGGADAGAFSINASTGALTFQSAPNYEAPGDSDGDNAYVVTVQASDGTNTDTQTITVTVDDVNEFAPAITSDGGGGTATVHVDENATSATTVAATDADAAATVSYSIVGGADAGAFSINASTGALTFQSAPNYELPGDSDGDNAYVVTVQASDGTNTDTQTITVYVDDINDASPVITSDGGDATASVGASEGATAVTAVTATDADAGATLSYSIVGGADAGAFSINASTGALTFQSAPNYELPGDSDGDNAYVVTVQASDGTNADTQTITVTVSDANEFAPSITYDGGGETADAAVDEGGTAVATIAATDGDDTATLGYSIVGGADAGAFSINASTGALTFQSAPNYEAPGDSDGNNAYVVTVQVSDGTNTDTQTITVTVNDANEFAPAITSDGGGATAGVNVDENTTSVTTVTATDADGTATISYSIAGGADAGAFSINASTGALTFQSAPDREQQATYTVQVQANDGTNADTQTITVTVDDANDTAPEIVSDGGGATADVDANENATSVTTVAATDADTTGTLTYSIAGGADAGAFSINASTGVLTFQTSPDRETPGDADANHVYEVIVSVDDGNGGTDSQHIQVSVEDENEFAPILISYGGIETVDLAVNDESTEAAQLTATDEDATATLVYSIAGGADADAFEVDAATGALTFLTPADYEMPSDANADHVYEVEISVSDGTHSDSQRLEIEVLDITAPDAPSIELSEDEWTNEPVTVELTGEEGHTLEYRLGDEGAWQTYAGAFDVSDEGSHELYARQIDPSNNISDEASATIRIDTTKPVVTMHEPEEMSVYLNGTFTDPGYGATDNFDADVAVTVTGSVYTSELGTYELRYNATDDAGNAADERTRTVHVVPRPLGLQFDAATYVLLDGETIDFELTLGFNDGSDENVTLAAEYAFDPEGIAGASGGAIEGLAPGTTVITATYGDFTATADIVVQKVLVGLTFDPAQLSIDEGRSKSFRLIAEYSDGTEADVTGQAEYAMANENVATLEDGRVKGKNEGGTTLAASYTDETGSAEATLAIRVDEEDEAETPPPATNPQTPAPEQTRTVNVEVGGNAPRVQVEIVRNTNEAGSKVDSVDLGVAKTEESIALAAQNNSSTLRVVIDDLPEDPADEVQFTVPTESIRMIGNGNLNLQIQTPHAVITLPESTVRNLGLAVDLFFRVVPIRDEADRTEVVERVVAAPEVIEVADGREVETQGMPMTIETNLTAREVRVTFPLDASRIPADAAEREAYLNSLAVYIEHSDGENVLQTGQLEFDEAGEPIGISIVITKFSTFTIVAMSGEEMHQPYIQGYPEGAFRPDQAITRAEMAALLARLSPERAEAAETAYADVTAGHWAADAIRRATAAGLMKGDTGGTFRPDDTITRAEMATIAARWLALTGGTEGGSFADAAGHWASDAIAAVQHAGVIAGYEDGTFRPDRALTRAEAVKIMNRILGRGPLFGVDRPTWSDVPASHWAFADVEEASRAHDFVEREGGGETMADENDAAQ